jgi:hypothetical protein
MLSGDFRTIQSIARTCKPQPHIVLSWKQPTPLKSLTDKRRSIMTKQFAKKSLAAALTTAALTFAVVTPAHAADQSDDWFEHSGP